MSPSFNVIPIIEEDLTEDGKSLPSHKDLLPYIFDDPKPSDYFYVFNSHSKIDYGKLCTIIGLNNKLLIRFPKDNHKLERDIERLKSLADPKKEVYRKGKKVFVPQIPMVSVDYDSAGNVTRIHLLDCVLLIRLSDHNVDTSRDDHRARNYKIRKSLVDNICYYNVEDYLNERNPKEKLCEKHLRFIERDFREKLVSAGIAKPLIDEIISKVSHIVRLHYGETMGKKGR